MRACRVQHDLIVAPEPFDELAALVEISRSRRPSQNLVNRALAVNRGEHAVLRGVYRQSEVGKACARLIRTAAAPAGRRSRTINVHGRRNGT